MDLYGGIGAGLGSLAGGLGRLLEPLDYPRRALWNVPGALARGDWQGAMPGLLGAGAGLGLAATGVGLPLAMLGGAAVGGLGTAAAGGLEDAPRGQDLVRMLGGDPASWGGWGAGLALDIAGDPLSYAGGLGGRAAAAPEGLEALSRFAGDESGALRFRAPYAPEDVARLTGVRAAQISHPEASTSFASWIASLSPEERTAVEMYTRGPQQRISHALRGQTSPTPGKFQNPFEEPSYGSISGAPRIEVPEDVHSEVVPYLDAALSRSTAPKDLITYRGARQFAEMTPENAQSLLGKTLHDPSYLSTTVDPWGRFYGNSAHPSDLLLDIAVPKGTQGGYAGSVSRWDKEKELILPRGMPMQVAGVQKVPVQKIDYQWYRLDPEGKPIPHVHATGGELFSDRAHQMMEDLVESGPLHGDFVVPHSWMSPHWERLAAEGLQGEGEQTNALLKALGVDLKPHEPSIRRRTPVEVIEAAKGMLEGAIRSGVADPTKKNYANMGSIERFLRFIGIDVAEGRYPDQSTLEWLKRDLSLPYEDLLRSFARDESGALKLFGGGGPPPGPPRWRSPALLSPEGSAYLKRLYEHIKTPGVSLASPPAGGDILALRPKPFEQMSFPELESVIHPQDLEAIRALTRQDMAARASGDVRGKLGIVGDFGRDESGAMKFAPPGLNPELHDLAASLGPRYEGGPGKFLAMAEQNPDLYSRLRRLGSEPGLSERLAGELSPGATVAGAGGEAIAFRNADGSIVRIGDQADFSPGRPEIRHSLQPYREAMFGTIPVEHLPPVRTVRNLLRGASDPMKDAFIEQHVALARRMREELAGMGYNPFDVLAKNVSYTPENLAIVHDRGAILPGRTPIVRRPTLEYPDAAMTQRLLAARSPEAVRAAMAEGLAQGTRGQGVADPEIEEILAILSGDPTRVSRSVPVGYDTGSSLGPEVSSGLDDWLRVNAGAGAPSQPIRSPARSPAAPLAVQTPATMPLTPGPQPLPPAAAWMGGGPARWAEVEAELASHAVPFEQWPWLARQLLGSEGIPPFLIPGLAGAGVAGYYGPDVIRRLMSRAQPQTAEAIP